VASASLTIEQMLTLLAATPPRIAALTAGMAPAQLQTAPGGDAWSLNDVLAHLRACADVWGGCMMTMLAEDRPTLRAINPRAWIEQTDYREQEFPSSLRAFTAQRAELLAVLDPLPPAGWSRTATVTGAGTVLERTLLDYGVRLTRHERQHVNQIAGLVAKSPAARRSPAE
jgi:hypothetical protein